MTVPSWNAEAWHRKHMREAAPPSPRRRPNWLTLGIVAVLVGAAAVSATSGAFRDEQIGICHATGSSSQPFVYLQADKNGYEHGHHRHHTGDYFVTSGDCSGIAPEEPSDVPDENVTEVPEAPENETDGPEAPEAPEEPEENGTVPEETNETAPEEPAPADPEPAPEEPAENETANTTAPDMMVRQTASQDDFEVILNLVVRNIGDGAGGASLSDALPDLRRSWHLGGTDAADCVLDGRDLDCWFGTLAPGESRSVQLRAYTDRMPCGFSLTNTAYTWAEGDSESRNDASSASIAARAC